MGSSNTVAASRKDTPCFFWLLLALTGSEFNVHRSNIYIYDAYFNRYFDISFDVLPGRSLISSEQIIPAHLMACGEHGPIVWCLWGHLDDLAADQIEQVKATSWLVAIPQVG